MKRLLISLVFVLSFLPGILAQDSFYHSLADSAFILTKHHVHYDPGYFRISYPGGDVPADKGVCTDVVIRAYRMVGIDLQEKVHEDMLGNFILYPQIWGATGPDSNIDHRRVPNLMTYFRRHGEELTKSLNGADYQPGDIVCWDLGGGITHIGIVSAIPTTDGSRYKIIHNIGAGQVLEDMLFDFRIIGHYRYGH